MKGLESIPGPRELTEAYSFLQSRAQDVTPPQLALWSQWARFDPRLAEQWVEHCARRWKEIPSGLLGQCLAEQPWPAAGAVLLEHALQFGVERGARKAFSLWMRSAVDGIAPAPGELFFIGTRAFAGTQARLDAERAIRPYLKWGYLGRDPLVNKAAARVQGRTLLPARARREVLRVLIEKRRRIRVDDYREALEGCVGVRQAEKDLQAYPGIRAVGHTRGRFYVLK